MVGIHAALLVVAFAATPARSGEAVQINIWEGLPEKWQVTKPAGSPTDTYTTTDLAVTRLPAKMNPRGIEIDRACPLAIEASTTLALPAGPQRIVVRSKGEAWLLIDGKQIAKTQAISPNSAGHEPVPVVNAADQRWREIAGGDQEKVVTWQSDGKPHNLVLWAVMGARKLRPEPGELSVSIVNAAGIPVVLGSGSVELSDDSWTRFARAEQERIESTNTARRRAAEQLEAPVWAKRHELARAKLTRVFPGKSQSIDTRIEMPLKKMSKAIKPAIDDASFLKRLSLDTIGVPPTAEEVVAFLADKAADKRSRMIEKRLADPRWADAWMGYWQDVLAENPGILKPTLNNTGPFRRFLYLAMLDDLSFDRIITELVRMDGSSYYGGPAGFGMATQNDAPMAAKAHVLAKAFLAAEMKCARCHDAPAHPFDQEQLFSMAGLLAGKPQVIPATSTVRSVPGARTPAVSVSLHAGDKVAPSFSLGDVSPDAVPDAYLDAKASSRERLAALIVSPTNPRFPRVMANRIWARLMGAGIVEPVDDWDGESGSSVSHPELLDDLAREFVASGYDVKQLARLIFNSRVYAAQAENPPPGGASAEERRFAGPVRRRLNAEQLVDSLFAVAGKSFGSEELCVDPEGRRPANEMLNLGRPRRAWEFASTANERDRPALSLPITQTFVDLLQTYGWRPARQDPITVREEVTTPLQPALLANGVISGRVARLSDDSALTELALGDVSLDQFVNALSLRVLSRPSTESEKTRIKALLQESYANRVVPGAALNLKTRHVRRVSWSNHLHPRATQIQLDEEREARAGDPPTYRLRTEFRESVEDVVWAMINSPEFVFVP